MEAHGRACSSETLSEDELDMRRGPWTLEEDVVLMNYIASHGEGRWNLLARCAGLKRTGKSCRLRWLNYLRPDVRRGNITAEEQLLILELHSRWGNRWSRIAQYLPGRTDNEIKNYWRTRVQKHAKHLQCDVDSKQFKDVMRYLWIPRLIERIRSAAGNPPAALPMTEYGIAAEGNHPSIGSGRGEGWEVGKSAAESSSDSWKLEYTNPESISSASSGGDCEVAENRKGEEGIQLTAPPQIGGGKGGSAESSLPLVSCQGYAYQGTPELEQYNGPIGDTWNIDDFWYLV